RIPGCYGDQRRDSCSVSSALVFHIQWLGKIQWSSFLQTSVSRHFHFGHDIVVQRAAEGAEDPVMDRDGALGGDSACISSCFGIFHPRRRNRKQKHINIVKALDVLITWVQNSIEV